MKQVITLKEFRNEIEKIATITKDSKSIKINKPCKHIELIMKYFSKIPADKLNKICEKYNYTWIMSNFEKFEIRILIYTY